LFVEDAEAKALPLAAYVWVHAAALVAMAAITESSALLVVGQGVELVLLFLVSFGFTTERLAEYVPLVALPMLAFWSLPLLTRRFRVDRVGWLSSAIALVFHFPFLYAMTRERWGDGALGAIAVACGLLALVMLRHARANVEEKLDSLYALLGGVALLFFTAAFPILLHDEWLTVAWALEAGALGWLRTRVKHRGLLIAIAILVLATLARLVLNPAVFEYHPRSGTPIVNWWLYTYGISAGAILVAWRLLRGDAEAAQKRLPAICAIAAGVILFVLMNIEIADYYSTGTSVAFNFSSGGLAQDMTYTLAWGLFALGLFGVGMAGKSRAARIWALVLLCVTVAKASLHDLWALGSLYRVGAIVGLAFALLAVSFLTQRFVLRKDAP
jgi:uncharacterized membrane protein